MFAGAISNLLLKYPGLLKVSATEFKDRQRRAGHCWESQLKNSCINEALLFQASLVVNSSCIVIAVFAACLISIDLHNWHPMNDQLMKVRQKDLVYTYIYIKNYVKTNAYFLTDRAAGTVHVGAGGASLCSPLLLHLKRETFPIIKLLKN